MKSWHNLPPLFACKDWGKAVLDTWDEMLLPSRDSHGLGCICTGLVRWWWELYHRFPYGWCVLMFPFIRDSGWLSNAPRRWWWWCNGDEGDKGWIWQSLTKQRDKGDAAVMSGWIFILYNLMNHRKQGYWDDVSVSAIKVTYGLYRNTKLDIYVR